MLEEEDRRLYVERSTCRKLGFIPRVLPGIKVDDIRGCSHVDECDNGELPDLTDANFNNDGVPTYYLSNIPYVPNRTHMGSIPKGKYDRRFGSMQSRCYNSNHHAYKNYGGRGIKVCDAWHRMNPYGKRNYVEWMESLGDIDGLDIDRKINNDNYHSGNCRPVTRSANCRNLRKNVFNEELVCALRREYKTLSFSGIVAWIKSKCKLLSVHKATLHGVLYGPKWTDVDEEPAVKPSVYASGVYDKLAKEYVDSVRATGESIQPYCKRMAKEYDMSPVALYGGVALRVRRDY